MRNNKSKAGDESHAILTTRTDANGRTVHYAGFAWARAGDIRTAEQGKGQGLIKVDTFFLNIQ